MQLENKSEIKGKKAIGIWTKTVSEDNIHATTAPTS